jgi:hypothetical protein
MKLRSLTTPGFMALLVAAVAGAPAPARAASSTWEILINASQAGLTPTTSGNVDLTLNAGSQPPSPTVSARVFGLATDGMVGGVTAGSGTPAGDVSGLLPGTVLMDNGGANNELTQDYVVGSFFDVFVTLSGSDIGNPSVPVGTTFSVTVYDAAGNAATGQLLVNQDGSVTPQWSPDSGVMVIPATLVPEPSSAVMAGLGLVAIAGISRRRRRPFA